MAIELHPGANARIERSWHKGDEVCLELPMRIRTHRRLNQNTQESRAPDGSPVAQQVLRHEYLALSRGPLVYATTLIDGFKTEETIRPPAVPDELWLRELPPAPDEEGPAIEMSLGYRAPLTFWPYYCAGGREDGAWRLTPSEPHGKKSSTPFGARSSLGRSRAGPQRLHRRPLRLHLAG